MLLPRWSNLGLGYEEFEFPGFVHHKYIFTNSIFPHLVSVFLCLFILVSLDIGMCSKGRMRLLGLFISSLPRLPCHKAVRKQWVQAEGSGV